MAIVNFSNIIAGANLGGLSTDAKPTINVPTGYVFLEFDTGKRWIFNVGNWYPLVEQTSITGSLPNQILTQAELVAANTTILNGGYYQTALQTLAVGKSLGVYYHMTGSNVTQLELYWYAVDGTTFVGYEVLIASGARIYGSGKTTTPPSQFFKMRIINNAGADIVFDRIGYAVS